MFLTKKAAPRPVPGPGSSVVAYVPHYGRTETSNEWLEACLRSLQDQTLRPGAIIVIDDASPVAPDAVLRGFPGISLLRNQCNSGPYAIGDFLFKRLQADVVMMQDSDDLSEPSRLEHLLEVAEQEAAEVVGCQLKPFVSDASVTVEIRHKLYPADPRQALLTQTPGHVVSLPTCVVSVALVRALGGFASGLRFGGDSEFIRRAALAARVINVPEVLYHRRLHAGSLTQDPATGLDSPQRRKLQKQLKKKAQSLVTAYQQGRLLDLEPLVTAAPVQLEQVSGPEVQLHLR